MEWGGGGLGGMEGVGRGEVEWQGVFGWSGRDGGL